jgi:hypothetical protein
LGEWLDRAGSNDDCKMKPAAHQFGHERWSLTGITHTTASADAADAIVDLPTAPVRPRSELQASHDG